MSIKRLYAILLVLVLLAAGVGAYTAQARPNAATTQFTIPLTADVVINGADGGGKVLTEMVVVSNVI